MKRVSRGVVALAVCLAALFVSPLVAVAYDETTSTVPPTSVENCEVCHDPYLTYGSCIHGNYSTTSSKCTSCHKVHTAVAGGIMLLPGATIQATCLTCHDGTEGRGVYGAIAERGLVVGAQHRCETTNVVPGGDADTGGAATMTFGGSNGTLSCDDCHSPHGASVVATFTTERLRDTTTAVEYAGRSTNNLLKQRPGDSASSTTVYGSDWCGTCHQGRLSGLGMPNNHPVESSLTNASPFTYQRAALLSTDAPTGSTVYGHMAQSNRGYLMPFPRTGQQSGHGPICQQCHEDSRSVGSLDVSGATGDAATFTVNAAGIDGTTVTVSPVTYNNPRFQNFPHETVNRRFLVEDNDDLCMNCHPAAALP